MRAIVELFFTLLKLRCVISKSGNYQKGESINSGRGQYAQPHRNDGYWNKLIQFGFRLLYNEFAFTYDPVSWAVSLGHWREWQRTAIPFLQGQQILELAHGPGHMLLELEQAGIHVIGLDLSPYMGRLAHKRIKRSSYRVSVVRGMAQELPFAAGSFSSVLATFPSEFILEPETLEAVCRALLPGGRFVIVVGAQLTGKGAVNSLIKWLYAITGQRADSTAISEHAGIWKLARERLSSAGFDHSIEQISANGSLVTLLIGQREQ